MNRLFSLDSGVMRFLSKMADLMILNILYFVTCIPIITIGASTTALYYVTLKMVKDEESYLFREYFKSFRLNFKKATTIWVIFFLMGSLLTFDIFYFSNSGGGLAYFLKMIFITFSVIYLIILLYLFPLLAVFENKNSKIIMFSFVLAIRHFPTTLSLISIYILAGFLLYQYPFVSFIILALIAFTNSFFLRRVFDKYKPNEQDAKDQELNTEIEAK